MRAPTIFSWGYWGWGTHTAEFVRTVDTIERGRGMGPPIFVDVRIQRNVRAPGFRDDAFEKLVGKDRYRWMSGLGNAHVRDGKPGVRIAEPSTIHELLGLVTAAALQKRRVIFFCSCESPRLCHRRTVARMLHRIAARQRRRVTVIEWPGGEPQVIDLRVPQRTIRSVIRGSNRIPLHELAAKSVAKLASLPWCSRVELISEEASLGTISGPARLASGWYLPVVGPRKSTEKDTVKSLKAHAMRLRTLEGYAPQA